MAAVPSGDGGGQPAERVRTMLHLSDAHLNRSAAVEGDIAYNSDSPAELFRSALEFAKQVAPDPDVLLYTGDSAAHFIKDPAVAFEAMEEAADMLETFYPLASGDTVHVTNVVGNGDTWPGYVMDPTDPDNEPNPSLVRFTRAWHDHDALSTTDRPEFIRRGFLAQELDAKLVVLTLNTLPYSPRVTADASTEPDPFGQFHWLKTTLHELQQAGRLAYIVGHIPPIVASHDSLPLWHPAYVSAYMDILASHASVVKAQLFGHIHSVEFRLSPWNEQQRQLSLTRHRWNPSVELPPLFTSAAISPLFGNNPAFMMWDIHPTTYELMDFAVYSADLAKPAVEWNLLFRATEAYGVSSLRVSELQAFGDRAIADPKLLERYYDLSKALSYRQPPCVGDAACRARWACSMTWWSHPSDLDACVSASQSNTFSGASLARLRGSFSFVAAVNDLTTSVAAVWFTGIALVLWLLKKRARHGTQRDR